MAQEWAKKFYQSKSWKSCRRGYIASVNGLCERCISKGRYVGGYIVHHKEHLTPGNINSPSVSLNWDNLEYVCQDCHNKMHMGKEILRDGLMFDDDGQLIEW